MSQKTPLLSNENNNDMMEKSKSEAAENRIEQKSKGYVLFRQISMLSLCYMAWVFVHM